MKELRLATGEVVLLDDEDYERVCGSKWWLLTTEAGGRYAYRPARRADGGHTTVLMHRIITGAAPRQQVDHWDNNGLNNQRENLRVCTRSQNNANKKKAKGQSSIYKGVSWNKTKKCWQAFVKKDGKSMFLGYFDLEQEAAMAYDTRAVELFGEFARPNFQGTK
jgi:hypothetical protein